jgi:hypothetical protein
MTWFYILMLSGGLKAKSPTPQKSQKGAGLFVQLWHPKLFSELIKA